MAPGEAPVAEASRVSSEALDVVLELESGTERCPLLDAIRISEGLFAIGRTEAPFASCSDAVVAQLSRRHARIFIEQGVAYAADLGSKNGTSVNGVALRDKPVALRHGDVIRFGAKLAFRVKIERRAVARTLSTRPVHAVLTPQRDDLGIDAIEILQFPFLISKADETFSKYRERYPHQVNYVSRRHAHLFLKGATLFVEDLGSTNGTFVEGVRLDAAAVALRHGATLAFGGNHFAYTVGLLDAVESSPTTTEIKPDIPVVEADPDKTTFVTTAHSFLDIFCVDEAGHPDDEINHDAIPDPHAPARRIQRGKVSRFIGEWRTAFGNGNRTLGRWLTWGGLAIVLAAVGIGGTLYFNGRSERQLERLAADGDYRHAAVAANTYLLGHPGDARATAIGTEALFKGYLPQWLTHLKTRDFDGMRTTLDQLRALATDNADARILVDEIAWIGRLEAFFSGPGRESADPPIRIFSDEDRMRALLDQWQTDTGAHQQRLDRIASMVPDFREPYALALSHLRKLQSDDSVYIAAIDRLKASIARDLESGHAEALKDEIADYADKYPRLAGLDRLQADLTQYLALDQALRSRKLDAIIGQMNRPAFSTPPFQARRKQIEPNLPPADLVTKYAAVLRAWKSGQVPQAIAGLQSMSAGPWADAVQNDMAHDQKVASQFNELQKSRSAPNDDDRVLSFYESLDPVHDVWFANAVQPDIAALRQKALARAQDQVGHAQSEWSQYRKNGAIAGEQRLEPSVSDSFSKQARLLVDAQSQARRAARMLHQLKADGAAPADQLLAQIDAEAQLQRRSLSDLSMALDPGVLSAKLALLTPSKESP